MSNYEDHAYNSFQINEKVVSNNSSMELLLLMELFNYGGTPMLLLLKYFFSPFPEVAESVQQELESYRTQEDEVKRLKSIMVRLLFQ